MDKKLWCDLKTDQEKADYLRSGQAWASGVVSTEIQAEVADVFEFRAKFNNLKPKVK